MLEYGAQEELESLENTLINLLSTLPYLLKDTINNKEMDSKTLQEIKAQINLYIERKVEAVGYRFFAQVADTLCQNDQEKIANTIAQILIFYTQPNTLETQGYKISWTPTLQTQKNITQPMESKRHFLALPIPILALHFRF